jgi:riboflavin synthase
MFTGLIREIGKVESFSNSLLKIRANYTPKIGDSIAVNGTCLTVVELWGGGFSLELSPETETHIATENLSDEVHIEPAMIMGDRFEGHVVQGHIDTIGTVRRIENNGNSTIFEIGIESDKISLMMPKGSVAIDGVSLTINRVLKDGIELTIIPHTIENTIFKNYRIGTRINIETDLFARYVARILNFKKEFSWEDIDQISAIY